MAEKKLTISDFSLIGSGNVANALGKTLQHYGLICKGIWSRNQKTAQTLSNNLKTKSFSKISELPPSSIIIICVPDQHVIDMIKAIPEQKKTWIVHCSGSTPLPDFNTSQWYGVLYPLQTINKLTKIPLSTKIPFLIEASPHAPFVQLESFANLLSENVYECNSHQRINLHMAAVFSNNFCNHLLGIAQNECKKQGINPKILKPLIKQTISNALNNNPFDIQTGPASRNDHITISKHLKLLENNNVLKNVYESITKSILNRNDKHN
jgi:predicted short-subunit dehydrogenase-like oxidoreductase (DUF2520 family)